MTRLTVATATAACFLGAFAAPLVAGPAQAQEALEGLDAIHLEGDDLGYTRPRLVVEGCLVEKLEEDPAAAGFAGKATFDVLRDGEVARLSFAPPPAPRMEQALRAAFAACPWRTGLDPYGKPVVVQVTQPLKVRGRAAGLAFAAPAVEVAPGQPPPPVPFGGASLDLRSEQARDFRRPEPVDPACLDRALGRFPVVAGFDNKVKFAVMRDGSLRQFSFFAPVTPPVERAVVAAFEACPWSPARDPEGTPLAVWVIQPVKVAGVPPPPP